MKEIVRSEVEAGVNDALIPTLSGMERVSPQSEVAEVMNLAVLHAAGIEPSECEIRRVPEASVYSPKVVEEVVKKASFELMESPEGS